MSFWSATILLFLVMDPLGNLPVFAAVLKEVPPPRQPRIVLRELLIALAVLLAFLLGGHFLLDLLHISRPALSISGGLILFVISVLMVFPIDTTAVHLRRPTEPFIVPLAVPLIAGPSAMTVTLVLSSRYPGRMYEWIAALVLAWLASSVILLFSRTLTHFLGDRGVTALERLMGMILIVLAVQMFLNGISDFASTYPSQP